MTRYIDAELLEKSVLKPSMFDINREDVLALIAEIPTADVVPRSEYDELLKAYSVYEEITGLKKAKHDVAREIFEEIERLCDAHLYWNNCSIIQCDDIAELKKKYTEGNDA